MPGECSLELRLDGYLIDLQGLPRLLASTGLRRVVLEAPQGMVRLLPRIADVLEACLGVEAVARLEPSYGLCSLSPIEGAVLVHIGHEFYPYPFCRGGVCSHRLPGNVLVVPGVYLGGDPEALAEAAVARLETGRVALGYSAQHKLLAPRLAEALRRRGVNVEAVEPVVGCYYSSLTRLGLREYIILAGGRFHGLGLGLATAGDARVINADPYTGRVEDLAGLVSRTLATRMWKMREFLEARSIGVIEGLFPGQNRPRLVEALVRLARLRGRKARILAAERLTREYLDNLSPDSFDAYVVTSCPRLAVEDLGDYWKPVLAPGEARVALLDGAVRRYSFPW